jgi:hypothetical protein
MIGWKWGLYDNCLNVVTGSDDVYPLYPSGVSGIVRLQMSQNSLEIALSFSTLPAPAIQRVRDPSCPFIFCLLA